MTKIEIENPNDSLGARVRQAARARFTGRHQELSWLTRTLLEERVPAVFIHGIGGIGKTSLCDAFEAQLCETPVRMLRLDGHETEPTPEGFLSALAAQIGVESAELMPVVRALEGVPELTIVIAIDEYDGLRLIDTWLRRTFVPALPARARLLFIGRSRPVAAWTAADGWDALVRSLEILPLTADDTAELLTPYGLTPALGERIAAIAQGHPLALKLAAAAVAARPDLPLAEVESRHVIDELVRRFLSDVRDPKQRAAVEAASVLRRVTRPLLARMLGVSEADHALEALAGLPFVERAADGLVVHQSVRRAVESALRALDPTRYVELRHRAWQQLNEDVQHAPRARRWQVTADVLYLLEHPALRDAFFPRDLIRYGVEPAAPHDEASIFAICERHAGAEETRVLRAWWSAVPEAFQVVRDGEQRVIAFYVVSFEQTIPHALWDADPLLMRWRAHRERVLPGNVRPVLFCRATLSAQGGGGPSEERACCFIDIKRLYMQNLNLAAIYTTNHGGHGTPFDNIGFQALTDLTFYSSEGFPITSAMLDFGPGVLAWLGRVIDAQCDPQPRAALPVAGFALDRDTRELVIDGERKPLTRLEYGVLDYLTRKQGAVASRDELLEAAWGQAHTGSNVVDAVVRTLRKKLGAHASAIQTVTGFGYKLSP